MTKEDIDRILQIISDEDKEKLIEVIKDENLKNEIKADKHDIDFYRLEILKDISGQIPEELVEYAEFKAVDMHVEGYIIINVDRAEKASKRYYERIDEISHLETDEQKIEALKDVYNGHSKAIVALTLQSDELKLELIKQIESDLDRYKIVMTLSTDNLKVEGMKYVENNDRKLDIAKTLSGDEALLQGMDLIQSDYDKIQIFYLIDEKKIEAISKISNTVYQVDLIMELNDDEKVRALEEIKGISMHDKAQIIFSIDDEETKIELLGKKEYILDGKDIVEYIKDTISDEKRKIEALYKVKDKLHQSEIESVLYSVQDDAMKIEYMKLAKVAYKNVILSIKNEDERIDLIKYLEDKFEQLELISMIENSDKRKSVLEEIELTAPVWKKFRALPTSDIGFLRENLSNIIGVEMEGESELEEVEERISRMFEKNNEVIKDINFRLATKKYIDLFGEDRINLISCYYDVQSQILQLDDKELNILAKIISNYEKRNDTDEWTRITEEILNRMSEGTYKDLIQSIEDIDKMDERDIEAMTEVLQNSNWCNIENIEQAREFKKIREEMCEKTINSEQASTEEKREAVIQKLFGHDLDFAYSITEKFGDDIENIDDGELKDYVKVLKEILKIEDTDILKEIFENCEFAQIEKFVMERGLISEFGKKFNEGLYSPKQEDLVDEENNIYEAGTDFKIIMTSIGAFSKENAQNYKSDWNRPSLASQHFCASYIRNDMIGTAPINGICYGFSQMGEDALLLSGAEDVYSSWADDFRVKADENEKYYVPETQINKTEEYNEMDFKRYVEGVRVQPDYLIVFKSNGETLYMEEALKAQKDWGGMPIVIVDKDKCLEAEREKINVMLQEYEETADTELARQITQKVRNNRVTEESFCEDIDGQLDKIKEKEEGNKEQEDSTKEEEVGIETLQENYEKVGAKDRKEEMGKISNIYKKMQEIQKEVQDEGRQ